MEKQLFKIGDIVLDNNHQFVAFNKPAGLAVQDDKTGDKSLLSLGELYCKTNLFLLHRIDRPASGIILYAKNKKSLATLHIQFQNRLVKKSYLAVVKEAPEKSKGSLTHYLQKNERKNRSYASETEKERSKKAVLDYELIGSIDNYHLLKITLHSGRHHQIRAQLAAIGCPIKGDVKYGFKRGNKDRSIHLHAWKLEYNHPVSRERKMLEAALPDDPVWGAFKEKLDL